jgi:hypothetical protein
MIPAVLFFIYSEKPENMTSGTPKQIAVTYSKCYFDETCNPRLKGGTFLFIQSPTICRKLF